MGASLEGEAAIIRSTLTLDCSVVPLRYDFIDSKRALSDPPLNCCDAADEAEYVDLALSLATNSHRRKAVVAGIKKVLDEHMFKLPDDAPTSGNEYVSGIEDFLFKAGQVYSRLHTEEAIGAY